MLIERHTIGPSGQAVYKVGGGAEPPPLAISENMQLIAKLDLVCKALSWCFLKCRAG